MAPEGEAFLIDGHQPAHPIDHGASFANRINRLGLDGTGSGQKAISIHKLQPGEPSSQAGEGCREQQEHGQQPLGGAGLHGHNPMSARSNTPVVKTAQIGGWAPGRVATGGGPCHQ